MSARFGKIRFLIFVSLLISLVAASRCSLSILPREITFRVDPSSFASRPGPAISSFQYYAVAVSGAVANTVNAGDLGARAPSCLYLSGLVQFPVTYEQLTQTGVSLSISPGNYTFSVLGFKNSPVSNAKTLSEIFATAPEEYLLAQGSFDTAATTSITLSSSYSTSTPDRLPSCLPTTGGLPLVTVYSGFALASGASTIAYSAVEGGYPPRSPTGISMLDIGTNVLKLHVMAPTLGTGYDTHLNLSPVFSFNGEHLGFSKMVFEVTGRAGNSSYNGVNCTNVASADGQFELAVWNNYLSSWETSSQVQSGPDVTLTLSANQIVYYTISGKIVTTIRSRAYTSNSASKCAAIEIDSLRLSFLN